MKIGDLVKTKVSLMNNHIPADKIGIIVDENTFSSAYKIMTVRFADESTTVCYREYHLEVISER